jgi:hypothetical protein
MAFLIAGQDHLQEDPHAEAHEQPFLSLDRFRTFLVDHPEILVLKPKILID